VQADNLGANSLPSGREQLPQILPPEVEIFLTFFVWYKDAWCMIHYNRHVKIKSYSIAGGNMPIEEHRVETKNGAGRNTTEATVVF
jgi:hypothetical protein